jgi:hypothetical protein
VRTITLGNMKVMADGFNPIFQPKKLDDWFQGGGG